MIIKSNSQALGGGYECKTTTKKSPKGADLEKLTIMKEAMGQVQIQAKLPSSTTNQSATKIKINNSFHKKDIFAQRQAGSTYGAIGSTFG